LRDNKKRKIFLYRYKTLMSSAIKDYKKLYEVTDKIINNIKRRDIFSTLFSSCLYKWLIRMQYIIKRN